MQSMKEFLSEDFLLQTKTAQSLFHDYAKDMPVIDYHNHLSPRDIAEDRVFENLSKIWLEGDHYKWRAMRTNGVNEKYITGEALDEEKFLKWAETVPYTVRNPLYHWTHMELKNPFGVRKILNPESAKGIYPYLIYHQAITAIAEGNEPGFLAVGTDDGRVWFTRNDGKNWMEITNNLPKNKHVAKIFTSTGPGSPNLYLALNDRREDNNAVYFYKLSSDAKFQWQLISSNLPASPANTIIEDPDMKNILYCGTDMGVYISKDAGKSWTAINGNLPASVSVNDMFIHPRDKKLVIATYGRGVYVIDDLSKLK